MKDLVNSGVNIIAYQKNGYKYGMTCAWMMQCDEDQLLMVLGSQSDTAKRLRVGDIIGISALSIGQEEIARKFGTTHSRKTNKFLGISYDEEDGALLINKASKIMKCEVLNIGQLYDNDEDLLVQVKVLSRLSNHNKFLSMVDYRKFFKD